MWSWLGTELHPAAFHRGPSLGIAASGCGGGTEAGAGRKGRGGARGCRSREAGKPCRFRAPSGRWVGDASLAWPCCLLPMCQDAGLSGSQPFFLFPPGALAALLRSFSGSLLRSTLGWGISQPDEINLISFPLSGGGEDDGFLFRGTLRASNGCLFSEALLSRVIFCPDSLRKFAMALCGFHFFFFPSPFLLVASSL